jgi:hypothetical protein
MQLYSLPSIPTDPILGFLGGLVSASVLWLSDAISVNAPVPQGVVELGGTIGLIGFLSYGCVTLWKQLQLEKAESIKERDRHRDELVRLHEEILGETRRQNGELIAVLKKLDPDERR